MRPRRNPDRPMTPTKDRVEFFPYALTLVDIYPTWFEVQFEGVEGDGVLRCSIPRDNKVLRLLCRGYENNSRLSVKKDTMKMGVYRVFGRKCGEDGDSGRISVLQDVIFSPVTVKKAENV